MYMKLAVDNCFTLLKHLIWSDRNLAFCKTGNRSAARRPITAMTTGNSIKVNAHRNERPTNDSRFLMLLSIMCVDLLFRDGHFG